MKTVKFKDLPEKVQQFCNRIGYAWIGNVVDTDWLHTKADWSKATDEERLAYAEWKYPIGTKVLDADNSIIECDGSQYLSAINNSIRIATIRGGISLYDCEKNKWAEIIEEKEESKVTIDAEPLKISLSHLEELDEKRREEFKKVLAEPTFKAGDETNQGIIQAIVDNRAWVKLPHQTFGAIFRLEELEKPDPDKHLREIAKEIMNKEGMEHIGQCTPVEILSGNIEQMLVEMGKKVEALKKGKEL